MASDLYRFLGALYSIGTLDVIIESSQALFNTVHVCLLLL